MVSTYLKLQYCAKVLSCNMHLFNCSLTHMPNHSITWQQFSVFQRKMARLLQVNTCVPTKHHLNTRAFLSTVADHVDHFINAGYLSKQPSEHTMS